jgi:hypothetical protein
MNFLLTKHLSVNHKSEVQHAGNNGSSDIVLIPQPTGCECDPLVCPTSDDTTYLMADRKTEMVEREEVLPALPGRTLCLRILIRREHARSSLDDSERGYRRQPDQHERRQCSELSLTRKFLIVKLDESIHLQEFRDS